MSQKDALKFLVNEVIGKADPDGLDVHRMYEQGVQAGYAVTTDDLLAATENVLSALAESGELSEEELEMVAGGSRQHASTAFQNFDQKANQAFNLLSQVMKSMNAMRMGVIRNLL